MDSVIIFVIGAMAGGVVGLITAAVCVASGNQETQKQNARMRETIYKTHDELIDLTEEVIKKTGSYEFYKQLKGMQDELRKALEEA